jgi:hypothetical protein
VWSSFWEVSPGSRRHTRARELTDLLHSLHERFRCLQHAPAGGRDLLQNLLLVDEHVHLVLDVLRHGLTQRFGLLAEALGDLAQLFGAGPGILGLLAQEFGSLSLDFLALAPLFMRRDLAHHVLTVLFRSFAKLFGSPAVLFRGFA